MIRAITRPSKCDQGRHDECDEKREFRRQQLARHHDAEDVAAKSKKCGLPETDTAVLQDEEAHARREQRIEDRLRQKGERDL